MGYLDPVKKLYYFFEDKWYSLLDKIDKKVPVYKIIDPIDKVIPSFILFLLLILFFFIFMGYLINFSSSYDVSIIVSDSDTKIGVAGVKLSGLINEDIFEKTTNDKGEAKLIGQGLTRNLYGAFWQLLTNEEDKISMVVSATKTGYKSLTRKSLELTNNQAKILLEKEAVVLVDINYPNSTRVTLTDEDTGRAILDSENKGYVKFRCANKTINPQPKTVADDDDGEIDGIFVLNETNCSFIVTEAYAFGYETRAGLSFSLPTNKNDHIVSLTKIPQPTTGNAKIYVAETASSPEKRIPGIEVTLTSISGQSTKDFTDNSGVAEFYNITAGIYKVTAVSPDGNYYALTNDANVSISVKVNDTNEILIKLVKLNPDLVRISNIKFVENEDKNIAIRGVKMLVQQVMKDNNNNKYVNGEIGFCNNGCISDENGIIKITGLDLNKEEKIVVTAYKEGYVIGVFQPKLFKTGMGPEIIPLKRATLSNMGEAKVFVKSRNTQKPIYAANTTLYMNSPDLQIKRIKVLDAVKVTDVSGRTDYNYLPKGNYYANASFNGRVSPDSNIVSIDVGEGIHQIVTINLTIDTNVSTIKLSLYDNVTKNKITSPVNPQVRLYEVADNNFSPTRLLETLQFSQTSNSFISSGYEPSKKLLLTVDIEGYSNNFLTINSLAVGENEYSLVLYPLEEIVPDSNVTILWGGIYKQLSEINTLNQAIYIDRNHPAYYAKIDVVLTKAINEGELLSMLRIEGPMYTDGIPTKTSYGYIDSESFSCTPQSKPSGINDNNYYFPTQNSCTTGTRIQSAIKWGSNLKVGTYSYVVKLRFDENAADNDFVKLKFRAKEKDTNNSSETQLIEKSFQVSKPLCNITDANCPKIFFEIKLNNNTLNAASGLDYFSSKKAFKSTKTIPLASKKINQLEVFIYNNSGSPITPTLKLYSYGEHNWLNFNENASGNIHMGNTNSAPLTITHQFPQIHDRIKSITKDQNIFPDTLNTTQFLILEIIFETEKYYTYISTKTLGSALKIDANFIAGILNQGFNGEVFSLTDGSPTNLKKATFTAYRNCDTEVEKIATSPNGTLLEDQDLSLLDSSNYFEGIVPGIYAYKRDCVDVKVSPLSPNFNDTTRRIYAGVGGAIDPALSCIEVKGPQNISKDFTLEWDTSTKITVTNKCNKPVKVMLESDLITSPSNELTLDTGRTQEYLITAKNKTYSDTVQFSDVLGVFPLIIKGKPDSAIKRKYAIVDIVRAHITNQNECFAISKDIFDFTSTTSDNSFKINNFCQYTLIEDYYIPKARINSFGIGLNMSKNKIYAEVDFNWSISLTGGSYSSSYITRTINTRGKVYRANTESLNFEEVGNKNKYPIKIDMLEETPIEEHMSTDEFWVKINDKNSDINLYGASIDGNIIIKDVNNNIYSIKPSTDYNIDYNSCECLGTIPSGTKSCHSRSEKNYCVFGYETNPIYENQIAVNIHFTLPEKMKIKEIDFNLLTGKDIEYLSYFITPFGTKDLKELVITPTNAQNTITLNSGSFKIYPQEGLTYILQDIAYNENTFLRSEIFSLINPKVKIDVSSPGLPQGAIIVWVQGRYLKARFFGEDNPEYNSGEIEMELRKLFASGNQHSIINIKDYVTSGKTRIEESE